MRRAATPEAAAEGARKILETSGKEFVRHLQTELAKLEGAEISRHPVLSRLADAAETVQGMERRALAYKAENIAGLRREPAMFVAEVPFRLNEDDGEGRLQVLYRRSKPDGQNKRWNARVVLDLQTTNLGPVVGDLRFVGREAELRMFCSSAELASFLRAHAGELKEALREKDFHCAPVFSVIPQKDFKVLETDPLATGITKPTAGKGLDLQA